MKTPHTLDVSELPDYAFGHRSPMWWATMGIVLIEGTMFVALLGAYFYLRSRAPGWPLNVAPPDLLFGTLNTLILLASCVPNHLYKKAAEKEDLRGVRIWLVVSIVFALAFVVVRAMEFQTLNCRWSDNAYASIVWTLLGFHTAHLVTDLLDTGVLTMLMFTGPLKGKRFVDVAENGMYWYFVVWAWVPIYVTLYLVPRWS
ncbi:MAG TPA: cytochrome c oxidase subunit 3 [Opitutus sp.]|nr:cytochrome c oxidase subunit 3 [Opitutus sp.]